MPKALYNHFISIHFMLFCMQEGQVLLKLLLPDLSDSVETLAHIACVSVQSYIDVETHIGPHFSELLDRTIGKLLRQQQKQLGSEVRVQV